jgi:hypothetical protein
MSAEDQLWTLIAQYVKRRHDLSPRYAKYVFHVLPHKASNQKLGVRLFGLVYLRHCEPPLSVVR